MADFGEPRTLRTVIAVAGEYGVNPLVPAESESYFRRLLEDYDDTGGVDLAEWLRERIPLDFISFGERPRWIQGEEWPFQDGEPMIFAGQIDVSASVAAGYFHDDTSLFLFLPKAGGGEPVIITQQY